MPGWDVRVLDPSGEPVAGRTTTARSSSSCRCRPGALPTLWSDDERFVGVLPVRLPRLLPDRRRRAPGRGRLPVRHGPHRRRDQRGRAPAVDRRDGGGAGRAPRRGRVRGDRGRRRAQGSGAARVRGAQGRRSTAPDVVAAELVQRVRDQIGAVAALRQVDVVAALPKTRSGKILRRTMRGIADGVDAAGAVHDRGPGRAGRAAPHPDRPTGFRLIRRGPSVVPVGPAELLDQEDQQARSCTPMKRELDQQVHASPLPRRHFELLADRAPHLLGRARRTASAWSTVRPPSACRTWSCATNGAYPSPKWSRHPDPELRQPHGDQGRSIDPERRVGCTIEQVFG